MNNMKKMIIIGGGASGLIASIFAQKMGIEVLILEKLSSIGKKILATGNGRCNLTNQDLNFSHFHSENKNFFEFALGEFDFDKTINFFKSIFVETTKKNGKIFPLTMQSSTVVDLLKNQIEDLGVKVKTDIKVVDVSKKGEQFTLKTQNGLIFKSDYLLIATGGKSANYLGSDGDGYRFAKKFGHTITPLFPTLVWLKSNEIYLKKIQGVKFEGEITLYIEKKIVKKGFGDILFTKEGLSGNRALDFSREVAKALIDKKEVEISINLLPNYNNQQLDKILLSRFELKSKWLLSKILLGLVNKKLISTILQICQMEDKAVANISKKDRKKVVNLLLEWRLKISDTGDFKRAEVTAGGVSTDEINPKTMESKLVKNLFFSGEVLDVDGDCGGYNLQWAWSSGYLVGCGRCN